MCTFCLTINYHKMKLTSLLHKIIENAPCQPTLSFYLEGDNYEIALKYSSESSYNYESPNYSVSTMDTYKSARIVELWSPRRFMLYYIDEKAGHWYEMTIKRNGIPIRLYSRSRLFFGK